MATLLYVHGTGVREPEYSKSFEHISESISAHQLEIKVAPCYWGGVYGAHLHHEGVSIPSYSETRSLACEDERDQDVVLWSILYQDPLYEFRLLASRSDGTRPFVPGRTSPLEALDDTVRTLTLSPELREKLGHGDVEVACFNEARKRVSASRLYREALSSVPPTSVDAPTVVARALVAQSIALCDEAGHVVRLSLDAALRDEIVGLLAEALGAEHYRAIGSWLKRQLGTFVQHIATRKIRRERGALTDRAYPLVGDILRYQGRGEEIRGFIRERIEEAKPPVGLLAHSLGGIACVDLLVLEDLPKVKLLVTVGSQAPFLYEIDKSDIDLPNDLLHVFEEGAFEIPELKRLSKSQEQVSVFPYDSEERVPITRGKVRCHAFPFIVMTSNAERELPPAFLRRCIRLDIQEPNEEKLARIVRVHFGDSEAEAPWNSLIATFLKRRDQGDLATDQLLNAIYLTSQDVNLEKRDLLEVILKHLTVR